MLKMAAILISVLLFTELSCVRTRMLAQENGKKDRILFAIAAIILILFAGLRTRYNDTATYIGRYNDINDTPLLKDYIANFRFSLNESPLFGLINCTMKSLNMDAHVYIFLYSLFNVGTYLWFFRKHTTNLCLTVFLFFVMSFTFLLAGMRQATATALALIAVDGALENKWVKYAIFLFAAACMHPFVLLYLILPLLKNKKPWSKTTWFLVAIVVLAGAFFSFATNILSQLAEMIGENFSAEDLQMGKGVNIFRFLVSLVPPGLFFVFRKDLKDCPDEVALFFHFSLVGASFMFLSLFGNQILLGRMPSYFSPLSVLAVGYAIEVINSKENMKWLKPTAVALYAAFFVYDEFINTHFWTRYHSISFFELLESFQKIFQ